MKVRSMAAACVPAVFAVLVAGGCSGNSSTPSTPEGPTTTEHDMSRMKPGETMPSTQHDMSRMKPGETMPPG